MFTNNWVNTKSKVHYFIHTFCKLHVLIPGFLFRVSQQRTILKPFISVSMDRVSTFRFKILWTFKLSSQTLWTNSLTETIKSKILVQKKCHMHAKLVTLIEFYSSYVHLNLLNCSNSRACTQKIRHCDIYYRSTRIKIKCLNFRPAVLWLCHVLWAFCHTFLSVFLSNGFLIRYNNCC